MKPHLYGVLLTKLKLTLGSDEQSINQIIPIPQLVNQLFLNPKGE